MTALKYAVKHDHIDTVRLLLEAGADVNLHRENSPDGEDFDTALHDAALCASTDLIQLLLDNGSHSLTLCIIIPCLRGIIDMLFVPVHLPFRLSVRHKSVTNLITSLTSSPLR